MRFPLRRAAAAKLERSPVSQMVLLVVVLLASNMIISDGVLTPAISVVSAIEGIQFQTGIARGELPAGHNMQSLGAPCGWVHRAVAFLATWVHLAIAALPRTAFASSALASMSGWRSGSR